MKWNVAGVLVVAVLIGVLLSFQANNGAGESPAISGASVASDPDEPARREADAVGVPSVPATPRYGDEIRRCTAPDGSTFFTNAIRCEEADLGNQLSVVQAPERVSRTQPVRPATTSSRQNKARSSPTGRCGPDRPTQEAVSNSVPRACRWEWGRAEELDRLIANANDPAESIWLEEYCERLREVRENGCRLDASAFCFEQYCPGR